MKVEKKKEEGRRKKEEGRRKKEEGRRKKEERNYDIMFSGAVERCSTYFAALLCLY
ncbi:hypothetical protein NDI47_01965 [Microcoleus vaginatus GB1-A2]|uniref:hypothetical protein n=1 Tax=Microcoleus vaginatus TaxID=119532 RepID=UPI00168853F0|nr:hypothetical protein [Microcoleus sp. FACHB-61]